VRGSDDRGAGEGTGLWVGIVLSILIAALAVGLAVFAANVRGDPPVAAPRPSPAMALDETARATVRRQAELVGNEDARLLAQLRALKYGAAAYVDHSWSTPTAVLTPRPAPYGVDDLVRLGAVVRPAPDVMELVMSVLVAPGARLEVHAPGAVLRMTSTSTGFTSIVAWKAALTLTGAPGRPLAVESWDAPAGGQDSRAEDGRAYVRAIGSEMHIASIAASALGFWSGRTGGIAFTGNDDSPSTGAIVDTTVHRCHYGLFTSHVRDLRVEGVAVEEAAADGVLFHRGTVGAQVHELSVRSSGADGVVAGRGSSSTSLAQVTVEGSGGNGITVDGRPMVATPGPSGASPEGWSDVRIADCVSRANGRAGILVWDADNTIVISNEVDGNAEGVIVRGPASGVAIRDNTVTHSRRIGIGVRDGPTEVVVTGNHVAGATTGVQVRNARAVVSGNHTENVTAHGVSVQGASGGSTVVDNGLAGRGPSALDLYRLDAGAAVAVAANTTEGWEDYRTLQQRIRQLFHDHPLLPLWVVLLAVPAVSATLARSRRRRAVRLPGAGTTVADLVSRTEASRSTVEASGTRVTVLATGWPRTGRAK
jgi:parallel beta-helix repeat protein